MPIQRDPTPAITQVLEDSPHISGQNGIQILGVRRDAGGTEVDADGDNHPLQFDGAGRLRTTASVTVVASADATLIRSDKDLHFTGALVTNAAEDENLGGLPTNSGKIRLVTILSDENLAWEIQFYTRDLFRDADLDIDTYLGSVRFAEGDGLQVAGAGPFRYDLSNLNLPYIDADASSELHVTLVNRSAAAKTAGAGGEVVVVTGLED